MLENGLIDRWTQFYDKQRLKDLPHCEVTKQFATGGKPVDLQTAQGGVILVGIGIVTAVIVLIFEHIALRCYVR